MVRAMCLPRAYRRRKRRGAALVEYAISLPLLVGIVFGCVDFGRCLYSYIAVTNAARAGAAVASVNSFTPETYPGWEQMVRDAVVAELEGIPGFDEAELQIPPPVVTVDEDRLRRFKLEVSYPFETLVDWPFFPKQVRLRRSVEMPFIR
jgi:Flp pilus assembly protein TadG